MSTFNWLVIGHLVGDWLLQNDWMARGKKKAKISRAGLAHCAIYASVTLSALWHAGILGQSFFRGLTLGALVFFSHWLIDCTDLVERWMRFYRQSRSETVRLMIDQTLHILVLAALVALT